MEVSDLLPLVEQLDDNLDYVEEAMAPLLNRPLTETSKKLPVLDKAKLHVWMAYALENIIFSYLRLHGVEAKQHPVMRELTRVKQYFDKIEGLETEPEQRTMTVDKQAAGRFIKHGLAGNDRFDLERKEQEAKSKARAQLKAAVLAKKAESKKPSRQAKKDADEEDASSSGSDEEKMDVEPTPTADALETTETQLSSRKGRRKAKREAKAAEQDKKQDKKEQKTSKKERRERKLQKRMARKAKEESKGKNEA